MRLSKIPLLLVFAVFALATLVHPAMARPRDQVMSDAFRCSSIADTTAWLDCYYGAAQPVRAALKLAPVPEKQRQLANAPSVGEPAPAEVAVRDQVMKAAVECTNVGDDTAWLNCYYAAAEPARAHLGLPPTTQSKPALLATNRPGLAVSRGDLQRARMVSYVFDRYGWFTVTLENHQVWRQISGDTDYAHWVLPAQQYVVQFSHGFMGSTNMRVIGHGGLYKVRRIG